MLRSAAINTIVSATLKAAGFAYTLLIVGLAARVIPIEQTRQLLLVFGYLAPLGLVQAGIGSLVLRAAMHNHVNFGSIANTYEVGVCFRVTAVVAGCVATAVIVVAPLFGLSFLLPTIMIMLVGFVCSVADQIWYATERAWVVNICLALSFAIMSVFFISLRVMGYHDLSSIAVITYCAPSLASVLSFASRLRDPLFRNLLFAARARAEIGAALRAGAPLFLVSVASSLLIALPTLSTFWHALPSLSTAEVPLFRLATIAANLAVALLVPFLPWLVRTARSPQIEIRRLIGRAWTASVLSGVIIGSGLLIYTLPWIVKAWIGIDITNTGVSLPWAFTITMWMAAAASGQFALMVCDAFAVAALVALCDLLVIVVLAVGASGTPVQVSFALLTGLSLHTILALALIRRTVTATAAIADPPAEPNMRHDAGLGSSRSEIVLHSTTPGA